MLTAISMSAIATNGVVPGNVGWLPAIHVRVLTLIITFEQTYLMIDTASTILLLLEMIL